MAARVALVVADPGLMALVMVLLAVALAVAYLGLPGVAASLG